MDPTHPLRWDSDTILLHLKLFSPTTYATSDITPLLIRIMILTITQVSPKTALPRYNTHPAMHLAPLGGQRVERLRDRFDPCLPISHFASTVRSSSVAQILL